MYLPKEGEGHYICTNCNHPIKFPYLDGDKIVTMGLFLKPKCPKCGSRKYKRDPRCQY